MRNYEINLSVSICHIYSYMLNKKTPCLRRRSMKSLLHCCNSRRACPSPQPAPSSPHHLYFFLCKLKENRTLSIFLPTCHLRSMASQIRTSKLSQVQIINNTFYLCISQGKFVQLKTVLPLKMAKNVFMGSVSYVK